jgi:hypothetical protein
MKEFSLAKKFNWELAHRPIQAQPIIIPTPKIKIVGTDVATDGRTLGANPLLLASYLPYSDSQSETFKKYNPKFYLFREKSAQQSRKKIKGSPGDRLHIQKAKAFYHPTHLNGINFPANTPIYGGSGRTPMHTEFDLGNINPYEYSTLGFVPYDFVQVDGHPWRPMTSADWGNTVDYYRFSGKKNPGTGGDPIPTKSAKSILFKIAIGIDNPAGSKTNPILFGELSDTFRLQLLVSGNSTNPLTPKLAYHFTMQLQLSSITRKR